MKLPIYGKIKFMFQTTNQICIYTYIILPLQFGGPPGCFSPRVVPPKVIFAILWGMKRWILSSTSEMVHHNLFLNCPMVFPIISTKYHKVTSWLCLNIYLEILPSENTSNSNGWSTWVSVSPPSDHGSALRCQLKCYGWQSNINLAATDGVLAVVKIDERGTCNVGFFLGYLPTKRVKGSLQNTLSGITSEHSHFGSLQNTK